MNLFKTFFAAALLAGLSCGVNAATEEMPTGLWQTTTKIEMPGMPPEMAAKMGNRVMTNCVKPGDQRKWTEQKNSPERGGQRCESTDRKVEGNTVTWKMKCIDGTSGEGSVTHNGKDAYTMVTSINSPRGTMKMMMEGKKISDSCEPK